MERYQHIVHFSYFGHTHDETFTVVKSIEDANASIGWYLVTGSGTPGGNINPTFVSIEYDSEFKVPTTNPRSKYRLCNSHDVSGTKRQP